MAPSKLSHTAVLISGAGPVGMFAAILMKQMGIEHRIIERNMHDSLLSKALGVHARTLEIFSMTGLVDDFLAVGDKVDTFHAYIGGKQSTIFSPLRSAESRYNFGLFLEQVKTGKILQKRYADLGCTVQRGWELMETDVVRDAETGEEYVETTIRRALVGDNTRSTESKVFGVVELSAEEEGKQYEYETIRSKYLIAADGGRSVVRHKLNIQFPGRTRNHRMILYDGLVDTELDCTKANVVCGDNDHTFAVVPLSDGRVRCILDAGEIDPNNPDMGVPVFEDFQKLAAETLGTLRFNIKTTEWLTFYRVNERIADQYAYKGRIFLAGDAAHVHSPVGGQGMNLGLQDVFNLTWKIAYVERGLAVREILDTYGEERKPAAKEVVSLSSGGFGFIFAHNTMGQILRNSVLRIIPYILPYLPASTSPSRAAMLLIRYHENLLNQRHPKQAVPKDECTVGVRARDGAIKPYLASSGVSENENDSVMLQTLWDGPGVFHILVFGTKRNLTDKQNQVDQHLTEYLQQWRNCWQLDPKRPMFETHVIGASSVGQHAEKDDDTTLKVLANKAKGEGKLYIDDKDDTVHVRYGISPKNGSGAIVVVRPDGHIGYRVLGTSKSAWEDTDRYFRSFLLVRDS